MGVKGSAKDMNKGRQNHTIKGMVRGYRVWQPWCLGFGVTNWSSGQGYCSEMPI